MNSEPSVTAVSVIQVVGTGLGTAVSFAADFAPVPYLGPAVDLVAGICRICANAKTNTKAMSTLGERCTKLLYVMKSFDKDACPQRISIHVPPALQAMVNDSILLLQTIEERMSGWAKKHSFMQVLAQNQISDDIKQCHEAIDAFLDQFNIESQMGLHISMSELEEKRAHDHAETIDHLSDIKNQNVVMMNVMQSSRAEQREIMAWFQEKLGAYKVDDIHHRGLSCNLFSMQRASGQLLPLLELNHNEIRLKRQWPVDGSTQFDIYEGEYLNSTKCAIKALRGFANSEKMRRRFLREVTIWRKVWEDDHGEHFLEFWGVNFESGLYPFVISPWMEIGDVRKYVNNSPQVNRKYLIRRIAEGVLKLHSYDPPIAHGDLKAANILVNDRGQPLIADFGLSKMISDMNGEPFTQSRGISDSYRWFAPELSQPNAVLSCPCDIYAFAMTVLEIMTGREPFSHIKSTPQVLLSVDRGEHPLRPSEPDVVERGLDDDLWKLLTECWAKDPAQRPTIQSVLQRLPEP